MASNATPMRRSSPRSSAASSNRSAWLTAAIAPRMSASRCAIARLTEERLWLAPRRRPHRSAGPREQRRPGTREAPRAHHRGWRAGGVPLKSRSRRRDRCHCRDQPSRAPLSRTIGGCAHRDGGRSPAPLPDDFVGAPPAARTGRPLARGQHRVQVGHQQRGPVVPRSPPTVTRRRIRSGRRQPATCGRGPPAPPGSGRRPCGSEREGRQHSSVKVYLYRHELGPSPTLWTASRRTRQTRSALVRRTCVSGRRQRCGQAPRGMRVTPPQARRLAHHVQ